MRRGRGRFRARGAVVLRKSREFRRRSDRRRSGGRHDGVDEVTVLLEGDSLRTQGFNGRQQLTSVDTPLPWKSKSKAWGVCRMQVLHHSLWQSVVGVDELNQVDHTREFLLVEGLCTLGVTAIGQQLADDSD